jgi:hypothetical protein
MEFQYIYADGYIHVQKAQYPARSRVGSRARDVACRKII